MIGSTLLWAVKFHVNKINVSFIKIIENKNNIQNKVNSISQSNFQIHFPVLVLIVQCQILVIHSNLRQIPWQLDERPIPLDTPICIKLTPISEFGLEFVCQINLDDF